jgi:hypothetical protein
MLIKILVVTNGSVTQERLDDMAIRILTPYFLLGQDQVFLTFRYIFLDCYLPLLLSRLPFSVTSFLRYFLSPLLPFSVTSFLCYFLSPLLPFSVTSFLRYFLSPLLPFSVTSFLHCFLYYFLSPLLPFAVTSFLC